jgi:GntR family transcriptional regulator
MLLRLDPHSGEPLYRQIVEAIKYQIASGGLAAGEQLPSVRMLASELKINMRTVVKAYDELSHAGFIVLQHGRGAFVTEPQHTRTLVSRRKELSELARRLIAEGCGFGASPSEVADIVRTVADEMERGL